MQTMQERILQQVSQMLTPCGYSLAVSYEYPNVGSIYAFDDATQTPDTIGAPNASVTANLPNFNHLPNISNTMMSSY